MSPLVGVGVDPDEALISRATTQFPDYRFIVGTAEDAKAAAAAPFDYVVMSLVLDEVYDIQDTLSSIKDLCSDESRIIFVTYNRIWRPVLRLAELLHLKRRRSSENYVPWVELENMLALEDFKVTKRLDGILLPLWIPLISTWVNRWLAPMPLFRNLSLIRVTVARPLMRTQRSPKSGSIVIAARNESGNLKNLVDRIPRMADFQEVMFVEGGSTDNTWEVIQSLLLQPSTDFNDSMKALHQPGMGKGDAVRAGFAVASGECLWILDADISFHPE